MKSQDHSSNKKINKGEKENTNINIVSDKYLYESYQRDFDESDKKESKI